MGLFSIFLVGAAANGHDGALLKGRRLFGLLLKPWVLAWRGRKRSIIQWRLTDTLSAILLERVRKHCKQGNLCRPASGLRTWKKVVQIAGTG